MNKATIETMQCCVVDNCDQLAESDNYICPDHLSKIDKSIVPTINHLYELYSERCEANADKTIVITNLNKEIEFLSSPQDFVNAYKSAGFVTK